MFHAIEEVGDSSAELKLEHLKRVEGHFAALAQNVTTHMRTCSCILETADKLKTLMTRLGDVTKANARLGEDLLTSTALYTDDSAEVPSMVMRATQSIECIMRDGLRAKLACLGDDEGADYDPLHCGADQPTTTQHCSAAVKPDPELSLV